MRNFLKYTRGIEILCAILVIRVLAVILTMLAAAVVWEQAF